MCPAAAPGGVQPLRLGGARGQRRGVLGGARQLDPERVVGLLADDAGAREHLGQRLRELLLARGRHERGARAHHLPRVRRSTQAGDALGAERSRSAPWSAAVPRGGTRPLATDTTAVRLPRPAARASRSPRPARPRARPGTRSPPAPRRPRRTRCAGCPAARPRAGTRRFSRSSSKRVACSSVRACSVVRSPPRASSTASAVPNDPAPITRGAPCPGRGARARPGAAGRRRRGAAGAAAGSSQGARARPSR